MNLQESTPSNHNLRNPFSTYLEHLCQPEVEFVQVVLRKTPSGYSLRHIHDSSLDPSTLRKLGLSDLRLVSQWTSEREFRPLKCAPNLGKGWLCSVDDIEAAARALDILYPGCVADCFRWETSSATPSSFESYAQRQTGMYQNVKRLDAESVAELTSNLCIPDRCLKIRLWTIKGKTSSHPINQRFVPCLEPCAIILEKARKVQKVLSESAPDRPSQQD